MDGYIYPLSLLLIALLSFVFFQQNNTILMIITLTIGVYIVYSHETGYTATEYKNEIVKSINDEAEGFNQRKGIKKFDESQLEKSVK
jgi:uncharacterized membrane protein